MNQKGLDQIPTPLEAVDTVADVVNQVVCTPFRVVRNVTDAISRAAAKLESDISTPRESGETPPPPEKLVEPIFMGIRDIVGGVADVLKGAVDGIVETGQGVQREINQFID